MLVFPILSPLPNVIDYKENQTRTDSLIGGFPSMVGVFRRSLSFPNKTPGRPSKPRISRHVRSISLPCRSHPSISLLKDEIGKLRAWSSTSDCRNSAWLCDGLAKLKLVHDNLDDILQLPQSRESLCRLSHWVERLLEDFLRFIDVYGIFQNLILALREEHSAAHVAIRKKDETKVNLYSKARKRMAKETGILVSQLRCIKVTESEEATVCDDELAAAIKDAIEVTVSVSMALFNGIAQSSETTNMTWTGLMRLSKKAKKEEGIEEFLQVKLERLWGLRNKEDEEVKLTMKKMKDLEDCIRCIDSRSEGVFRSLINTRVSILNALSC